MGRAWNEFAANVDDTVGLGLATLLLFLAATLVALGWYFWPRLGRQWLGRQWLRRPRPGWSWLRGRWLRWRWPWRRRKKPAPEDSPEQELVPHDSEGLPDLPVEALLSLADRLAAQGRFAEAVRERLRGIVRELVDAGVIANQPGWTVTELASAAGVARPPVRPPLDAASRLFSDIWYGQRTATAGHDARMREYASHVHAALAPVPAGGPR